MDEERFLSPLSIQAHNPRFERGKLMPVYAKATDHYDRPIWWPDNHEESIEESTELRDVDLKIAGWVELEEGHQRLAYRIYAPDRNRLRPRVYSNDGHDWYVSTLLPLWFDSLEEATQAALAESGYFMTERGSIERSVACVEAMLHAMRGGNYQGLREMLERVSFCCDAISRECESPAWRMVADIVWRCKMDVERTVEDYVENQA